MPACLFGEADRCEGNRYGINIRRLDSGKFQTELCCFVGHAVLGVLVADEAFLLGGGNQLAADVERGRGVVGQCAGKS